MVTHRTLRTIITFDIKNFYDAEAKKYFLLLILLLKKVGSARLRESDIHPISPKTPAAQYQPINRNKGKGKIVEDCGRD